ncbi:uncharacterized protein LOC100183252 [Ciona intestinalis]
MSNRKPKCCYFPEIPTRWLLFIEFAFMFGTTVIYFADIVTDIITLRMYYIREWYYAFGLSICFIVLPSILMAVLEYNFLKKAYGKSVPWKMIVLRTALNIPFQFTIIWYHCQLSYSYLRNWLDHIRGVGKNDKRTTAEWYEPTTLERSRGASLSSLNDLDNYCRNDDKNISEQGSHLVSNTNLSRSMGSLAPVSDERERPGKSNWWKRLTREQWLAHLNKLKLSESMLESLPQLLINLYLIAYYQETHVIQYISAVLSYISLCGGVVRYDKTRKDNEADQWMVDRTLLHSRAFNTRLEWPQLLFITIYKGSFLAARILAFVFFTIFFSWYIFIPIVIHWCVFLCYHIFQWYPDFSKVSRQLQQADYKYRAYIFLSHDFMSVFHASLMCIFIHVRPYYHAFLDQPYCFMFWYYVVYVTENVFLFLIPGIVLNLQAKDESLNFYQYYVLLSTELILNIMGCVFCCTYYLAVHKMRTYTAHAYPAASKILCCCCYDNEDMVEEWLPVRPEWTVCKQAETSEIFFLTKEQLKSFQEVYNTVVRNDRNKGRAVECFIDDRCKIFYAPRSKLRKVSASQAQPFLIKLNSTSNLSRVKPHVPQVDVIVEEETPLKEYNDTSVIIHSEEIDAVQTEITQKEYAEPTQEYITDKPKAKPRSKSIKSGRASPVRPPRKTERRENNMPQQIKKSHVLVACDNNTDVCLHSSASETPVLMRKASGEIYDEVGDVEGWQQTWI